MTAEKKVENKEVKQKYKIVSASDYYVEVRKRTVGSTIDRDMAICMLFEEYADKIVYQIQDPKSGDVKFVVKA